MPDNYIVLYEIVEARQRHGGYRKSIWTFKTIVNFRRYWNHLYVLVLPLQAACTRNAQKAVRGFSHLGCHLQPKWPKPFTPD